MSEPLVPTPSTTPTTPSRPTDAEHVCSAKGCRAPAAHAVIWNNPKLHTADRRKVWLACDAHERSLADFVALRGFLVEVIPVDQLADGDG